MKAYKTKIANRIVEKLGVPKENANISVKDNQEVSICFPMDMNLEDLIRKGLDVVKESSGDGYKVFYCHNPMFDIKIFLIDYNEPLPF
jgi:hypothetical protein